LMINWYPKRVIKELKKGNILELGIGHGFSTAIFSKAAKEYTVIEGSKKVIDEFHVNFKLQNVKIIESYFETFDSVKQYDNIIMGFILEHVDDPDLIIEKYIKYLKKDGKLFIAVPNAESLHRRIGYEANLLENIEDLSEADLLLGHKRYFTVEKLIKLVDKPGLKIVSIEGLFLKPLTTEQIINLNLSQEILNGMMKIGVNYPELSAGILMECVSE
ncbi:MAG: class I SAM-dependent methyltransferase, partial [Candidatus Thorarchaeota archaeon]